MDGFTILGVQLGHSTDYQAAPVASLSDVGGVVERKHEGVESCGHFTNVEAFFGRVGAEAVARQTNR